MKRFYLCAAVALILALASAASAQLIDSRPDAGVQGSGVVLFGNNTGNYAEFNITVTQLGPAFSGGFRWVEYPKPGVKPLVIMSRQIVGLKFLAANHVVVEATGTFMDKPARITFELLDDGNMDAVRIKAETLAITATTPVMGYEKGGGVAKGNVIIFRKQEGFTAVGNGSIAVKTNVGRFEFKASSTPTGAAGYAIYQETNPMLLSPMERPIVRIEMRKLVSYKLDGNKIILDGLGVINSLPAKVRITAEDNVKPGPIIIKTAADVFTIEATPTVPTFAPANYFASGPLTRGDIYLSKIIPTLPK